MSTDVRDSINSDKKTGTSSNLKTIPIAIKPISIQSSRDAIKESYRIIFGCANNILSAIAIIFLNKYIFSHCQIQTMTLTAIQMMFTSFGLLICLRMKTFVHKRIPIKKVLPLSIAFCAFVVFTNLSLEYNTIGTYQLFKVLTTPIVALISWLFYDIKYSKMVVTTLVPVVIGVCINSINDFQLTLFGSTIATIGFMSASLYQIWISERLKELEINSQQLLYYQAPLSALLLIPFILLIEHFPSYETDEELRIAIVNVVASGIVAFVVNLSVYWVIKHTSALTYNMIGHMKTVSILVGGFILFEDSLNIKQFLGILLTLFGLFSYTFVRMHEENQLPCSHWNANPTINIV